MQKMISSVWHLTVIQFIATSMRLPKPLHSLEIKSQEHMLHYSDQRRITLNLLWFLFFCGWRWTHSEFHAKYAMCPFLKSLSLRIASDLGILLHSAEPAQHVDFILEWRITGSWFNCWFSSPAKRVLCFSYCTGCDNSSVFHQEILWFRGAEHLIPH